MTFLNSPTVGRGAVSKRVLTVAVGIVVLVAAAGVLIHVLRPGDQPDGSAEHPLRAAVAAGETYDLGFLEPEAKRESVLAIANASAKPVRILNVRTGCPCATATIAQELFQPGDALKVRLAFVAPKKPQHYAKRLHIETDDPKQRVMWVLIKADVGLPLATDPRSLDFGAIASGGTKNTQVAVVNRSGRPVRLLYSTASLAGCVLKAPSQPVPPEGRITVPVVLNGASEGPKTVTFDVATDAPTQQSFRVTVKFEVVGAGPRS